MVGWLIWPLMIFLSFFSPVRHARWHAHSGERGTFVNDDRFFFLGCFSPLYLGEHYHDDHVGHRSEFRLKERVKHLQNVPFPAISLFFSTEFK